MIQVGVKVIRSLLAVPAVLAALMAFDSARAQSVSENPLRLSFQHVTASVADLEKEASWYEHVLGFKRSALLGANDDFRAYHMSRPGVRIDLVQQKGSMRQHEAQGRFAQGWLHVVFKTPDVGAAYKYLHGLGTDVKADGGNGSAMEHLTLHDPEGNEIGIAND